MKVLLISIAVILSIYIFIYLITRYGSFLNLSTNEAMEMNYYQKTYEPTGKNNVRYFSGEIIENPELKTILGDKRPFIIPTETPPITHLPKVYYYPTRRRPPPAEQTLKELQKMGSPPITEYRVMAELDYFNNPQPF